MRVVILLAAGLATLSSCGRSNNSTSEQPSREEAPFFKDFNTRLNSKLKIKGEQCTGGETIEYEGHIYSCETEEWLVTVDNINQCNQFGCTEVGVPAIVANLARAEIDFPGHAFFYIVPISPVSPRTREELKRVWVGIGLRGSPKVLFRNDATNLRVVLRLK